MTSFSQNSDERNALIGRLLNEELDGAGMLRLNELLRGDLDAQRSFVRRMALEAGIRTHAQLLDDDDFALLEVQTALDSQPTSFDSTASRDNHVEPVAFGGDEVESPNAASMLTALRPPEARDAWTWRTAAWTMAAATLLVGLTVVVMNRSRDNPHPVSVTAEGKPAAGVELAVAKLSGAVGARWAGAKLDLPEGELFRNGHRLELVEGLAELTFRSGARVVVQGPAILQIRDEKSAWVSVGRIAAVVPQSAPQFVVRTHVADLSSAEAEFGAEIDVDGSLVTQVYNGQVELQINDDLGRPTSSQVSRGQGLRVDATSGRVGPLPEPNRLRFVRYLPQYEMHLSLTDVVAGGDGRSDSMHEAYHRGINLADGRPADNYAAPVAWDGQYHKAQGFEFVDGVFIPDGKRGPVQIDSIGRHFNDFPPTSGDCWGGVIMARRPKEEKSLPRIRLEFHGDNYGYVNWLHIASKPEELSQQGYGLIGMHSNCGITFDLHAIRARYPNKKLVRFRSFVGNLESKLEAYRADAWVIVDGQLRYQRKEFSRGDGPEAIDIPLTDHDRFLVLAVTDAGANTAYDWVAFGDPVIEMTNLDGISADADFLHQGPPTSEKEADSSRTVTAAPGFSSGPLAVVGITE
jgi:hypothetical protein